MSPPPWQQRLRDNIARVRDNIARAARRAGRDPADVRLVGVTKYVPLEVLRELPPAGVHDIGESRVQQLVERARECGPPLLDWPPPESDRPLPRWHMIGHLQRNKAKQLLPHARIVHSLDSQRLAQTLQHHAAQLDVPVDVFIEVNVAGEQSKQGLPPESLVPLAETVAGCTNLRLRGLMTMAPFDPDPEHARPHFARLRGLLESLQTGGHAGPTCRHLSMGMSQDYAIAVEEGATLVRVGSALFEGLPTGDPRPA